MAPSFRIRPSTKAGGIQTAPIPGTTTACYTTMRDSTLYENWRPKNDPDAEPLWTVTIIITAAPDTLGVVHDRTPVILPPAMWDDWLAPETVEKADVIAMLAAVPEPQLTLRPVGSAVGNVRSRGPDLIASIEM